MTSPQTPANWYPDPLGRFQHRYWDGHAWTEHVATNGQQASDPLEAAQASGGYVVIDVETTGLSARQHRIVELAVVRTDGTGRPVDEWSQRFNPEGPVGATHIHGISDKDVANAPRFRDQISEVTGRLQGGAVVAHNAKFDLAFLRSEYRYAGWTLPWLPSLCTLDASDYYLPHLDRRRLKDCCAAAQIQLRSAHSALGDARATAGLLARYLDASIPPSVRPVDRDVLREAASVQWPDGPTGRPSSPAPADGGDDRVRARIAVQLRQTEAAEPPPNLVELLSGFSLIDALDEGAPAGSLAYLETLAEALEDGELSAEELAALDDVAATYELSEGDRISANGGLLLALCHLAIDDGKVTHAERNELKTVASLLDLPESLVTSTLKWAEEAQHARMSADLQPLPADWALGEPLRVGDKVVFTGCDPQLRESLEARAKELGVRVLGSVSRKTAMLVTDGSFSGTKAEAAAAIGVRSVHPDEFTTLLTHLQPAAIRARGRHA